MTRPDYCPVAQEPCQAMCALSDVRCQIRDTAPHPQREWVGLTDEAVSLEAHNRDDGDWNDLRYRDCWYSGFLEGAKWAESKLREKNGGEV